MILTDTHAHLYSEAFDEDRSLMMQRALEQGVRRIFVPAIDSTYTTAMIELREQYPDHIFLMMGLHPTHVRHNYKEELQHVEELLSKRTFYAVGEIGIDLHWDTSLLKEQQQAFKYQIGLAREHGLPIVIHCRESFDEIFEILEGEKAEGLYGIFHCFTGTLEQARKAIGYNMKLGIGGVVTYKNGRIDTFLQHIGLENIVLETDAPYLAPSPLRGKRNESAYLVHILKRLAEIYGESEETIAKITTANSKQVFGI